MKIYSINSFLFKFCEQIVFHLIIEIMKQKERCKRNNKILSMVLF